MVSKRTEQRRLQSEIADARRPLEFQLVQEKSRADRLQGQLDQAAKRAADLMASIAQRDQTIQDKDKRLVDAVAERDRILRIVDQFTSISIVPLGSAQGLAAGNMPKDLRKA